MQRRPCSRDLPCTSCPQHHKPTQHSAAKTEGLQLLVGCGLTRGQLTSTGHTHSPATSTGQPQAVPGLGQPRPPLLSAGAGWLLLTYHPDTKQVTLTATLPGDAKSHTERKLSHKSAWEKEMLLSVSAA